MTEMPPTCIFRSHACSMGSNFQVLAGDLLDLLLIWWHLYHSTPLKTITSPNPGFLKLHPPKKFLVIPNPELATVCMCPALSSTPSPVVQQKAVFLQEMAMLTGIWRVPNRIKLQILTHKEQQSSPQVKFHRKVISPLSCTISIANNQNFETSQTVSFLRT